jgi:uncharacterized membrane protein
MNVNTSADAGKAHLDTYLRQIQRHLGGLPDAEARETLAELRAHVLDKVAGDHSVRAIEAAIAELGSPREVARLNVTERVAAELEANRSPWRVLGAIGRLASLSVYGVFAFLVTLFGYALAAGFLLTAAVKPFNPRHTGLWLQSQDSYSWMLGVTDHSQTGRELLGWWIIPIGLALGLLLGWLTWRFGLFSVRHMRRTARGGRA